MDIRKGAKPLYTSLKLAAVVAAVVATVPVQAADEPTSGVTAVAAADVPTVKQDEKGFSVEQGLWRAAVYPDGHTALRKERPSFVTGGNDARTSVDFTKTLQDIVSGKQKANYGSKVDQAAFKQALGAGLANHKAGIVRETPVSVEVNPDTGNVRMSRTTENGVTTIEHISDDGGDRIAFTSRVKNDPDLVKTAIRVCDPKDDGVKVTVPPGMTDQSRTLRNFCKFLGGASLK